MFILKETKDSEADDFFWKLPVLDHLFCHEVQGEVKVEDNLREVTLKAIKDNCIETISRIHSDSTNGKT
jgi:hypothetical protein